jgi:integrase
VARRSNNSTPRNKGLTRVSGLAGAVHYDERAIARDLPDLVGFMMATGLRIGETTGLAWDAALERVTWPRAFVGGPR